MRRVAPLLLLVALLAGCGSGSSSSTEPPATTQTTTKAASGARELAAAAAKSTGVPSMKVDTDMKMDFPGLPKPISMNMSGVVDNATHRTSMTFDMSSLAASLGDAANQLGDPSDWRGQIVVNAAGGRFVMYMRFPFLQKLGGTQPWLKMDLNEVGKSMGFDLSQFTGVGSDPSQQLTWLRATSGKVTRLGRETVDGVKTTHYRATIDLDRFVDLVPAAQREAMRKSIETLKKQAGGGLTPTEVWIDEKGLVRKQHMTMHQTVEGQKTSVEMTMHYHDFGTKVRISLPPSDQVASITDMVASNAGK